MPKKLALPCRIPVGTTDIDLSGGRVGQLRAHRLPSNMRTLGWPQLEGAVPHPSIQLHQPQPGLVTHRRRAALGFSRRPETPIRQDRNSSPGSPSTRGHASHGSSGQPGERQNQALPRDTRASRPARTAGIPAYEVARGRPPDLHPPSGPDDLRRDDPPPQE